MLDMLIRGGIVVTPEEVGERDVGVQDGTIVAVTSPGMLPDEAGRVIDAAAKSSSPAVSSHMHTSRFRFPSVGPGVQRS